jgi:predicted DCC family thiol-disulfide oxidoreductase YuxK
MDTPSGQSPAKFRSPTSHGSLDGTAHWLFYDGGCGLCHGVVRWALPRDRNAVFLFAPLHGESFHSRVPKERQGNLPDSIVVQTPHGALLLKSDAVRVLLLQLGGPWRTLGVLLGIVPRPFSNWVYDLIAKIRHRLFKKPEDVCPVVPAELRHRFRP